MFNDQDKVKIWVGIKNSNEIPKYLTTERHIQNNM